MSETEIKNAKITSTMLGIEDHGHFTFMLNLDYGDSRQGAGGYPLDAYSATQKKRIGTAYGMDLIAAVMKTVGVDTWEDLKGKLIRVRLYNGTIRAIGNLLGDEWLDFKEFHKANAEQERVA